MASLVFRVIVALFLFIPLFSFGQNEKVVIDTMVLRREVDSLKKISKRYFSQKRYDESVQAIEEAAKRASAGWGRESMAFATCLYGMGSIYYRQGKYAMTELNWLEVMKIVKKTLGEEHADYASSLNNLALLYNDMGNYYKSEEFSLLAIDVWKKALGQEHPDYASGLENLANLYSDLGQYSKAEPLYIQAKIIREKTLGKGHPDYAKILMNLANLYWLMGQYAKSEPLHIEAKDLKEKISGKETPEYAVSLKNLASLYWAMGNYEKAEPLYLQAKFIYEKTLGLEHPDFAFSLNSLGVFYWSMGNYEKSESFYLQTKSIQEKALGKKHPIYAMSLNNLAILYWAKHDYKRSEDFWIEVNNLNQNLLSKGSGQFSERELLNYTHKFSETIEGILSFATNALANVDRTTSLIYSNILFNKGFLLNTANHVSRLALTDSATTEKYYTLKSYHRRLAAQYTLPIAERDSSLIADLEEKANTLEKDLVRTVAGYGEAIRQVSWEEVKQQLKPNEAAIEFVHYRYYDQKARPTDSTMYAALVLLPQDTAPHFVPLCEARQLDAIFNQPQNTKELYYKGVYGATVDGRAPLYQTIWAPLEPYLQGVDTIYYSPSGLLHRLNLGAIQPAPRQTLADRYQLVEMGSTRNLVVPPTIVPAGNTAALFGGIQYEMDSTKIAAFLPPDSTNDALALRGSGGFVYTDSTLRGGAWNYLPATDKEVTVTENLLKKHGFQTTTRRGYAATEEALQQIGRPESSGSPRVLHIATHGFFFPDPNPQSAIRNPQSEEPVFKISDNPMIRAGLLLSGANHAWKTGHALRPGMEDGILTAYEISQMNLRNTELVVLSACETGLGQIEGNEGVYGLQRAFKIAGAKYLLMSLWQVPDKATQELMQAFYEHWLDGGKSIPVAFRMAQQQMRKKYPNPFYWAGFVLVE